MLIALIAGLSQSPMDLTPTDSYVAAYRQCMLSKSAELAAEGPELVEVTVSRATDYCAPDLASFETVMVQTLQNHLPERDAASIARQMRDAARDSAARRAREYLVEEQLKQNAQFR